MKKTLLLLSIVFVCGSAIAQTEKAEYSNVINVELGKDLKGQTVTIDAEFFGFGMAGMAKPNKFKVGYIPFRCFEIGGEPEKNSFGGEVGNFFFIKKKNDYANEVKNLKKGDKVTITGEVYINNYYGYKNVNFIVHEITKI